MLQLRGAAITSGLGFGNTDSPAEGGGFETVVPGVQGNVFFYTASESSIPLPSLLYRFRAANWPGAHSRFLTTDNGRFTAGRVRQAPAMISTPGHRASRRRQREALPAWCKVIGEQLQAARSNPRTILSRFGVMPRRAKAVALDATSAPVPANNEWYRGLTSSPWPGPMVRIHFPPAVSQQTFGSS
jgi:hypothetical protein